MCVTASGLSIWSTKYMYKKSQGGLNDENAVVFDTGPLNLLLPRRIVVRLRNHILMHNSQGGLSDEEWEGADNF